VPAKYLHLAEVVELHGGGEVQQHVGKIWTLVGQLVKHRVRYQLDGQFDVAEAGPETDAAEQCRKVAFTFLPY
jgi:hypothetical protein